MSLRKVLINAFATSFFILASLLFTLNPAQPAKAIGVSAINGELRSIGSGGSEYRFNCDSDYLLNGLSAQSLNWRGLNIVSHIRGECQELDSTGQTYTSKKSFLDYVGSTKGGFLEETTCDMNSAISGLIVYSAPISEAFVTGFKLQCSDLPLGGKTRLTSIIGFETSKKQELNCPANSFARGLWVRFGEIVDSLGIRCGKVIDIKNSNTSAVTLNTSSKVYPYSQEISIAEVDGSSDVKGYVISKVENGEGSEGCALDGNILTAQRAGVCSLIITKPASGQFASVSINTNFTFLRADQVITIDDLGTLNKTPPFNQQLAIQTSGYLGTGTISFSVKDGTATGCALSDSSSTTTLTADSAGSCFISAQIAEDSNYSSASSSPKEFLFAENETDLLLSNLPPYDPASEPEKTVDLQVAAFAVLTVVTAGAGIAAHSNTIRNSTEARKREEDEGDSSDSKNSDDKNDNERESGDIASASSKKLSFGKRSTAIGDAYGLWRLSHSISIESKLKSLVERTSVYSPVLSRIFQDGSYLRAMFSTLALLPSIIGVVLCFFILRETNLVPIPPSFMLFITAIALATFDALAGLVIASTLFFVTLVTGNIHSLDHLMTSIGISAIIMTPALMTSAIRPLHRFVTNSDSLWERITDYFLAILLGGWAMEKIVSALNGLAGVQFPITAESQKIGLLVSLFILIRMLLEEIATYFFPERLADQNAELQEPKSLQPWVSLIFKTTIFFAVSYQFLHLNTQLIVGTALFILPQILANVFDRFNLPRTGVIGLLLPKGAPKMIIMIFIGGYFANWVQGLYSAPQDFITWSFVVLTIPGLVLSLLGNFATSPKRDWKGTKFGKFVYRFGGVIVAALILAIYRGVDLYHLVFPS